MPSWDPELYLRHADHRERPFRELLARVPLAPARVTDLGCGPGNSTAAAAAHWPAARVTGIDNSADMIVAARRDHPGLDFRLGDLLDWDPAQDRPDVIVSNAAFQWVAGHEHRFPDWIAALPTGGALAFQIPDNFDQPTHTLLGELRRSPRWKAQLGDIDRPAVPSAHDYLTQLTDLGCAVDVWETTYHQILTTEDAVVEWMRGTGLRPALDALPDDTTREEFLADYRARTDRAYPAHPWGTVLPYHRVFVVAVKK